MAEQNQQNDLSNMSFVERRNLLASQLSELDELRREEIPDIDRMAEVSQQANAVVVSMEGYLDKIEALMQTQGQGSGSEG